MVLELSAELILKYIMEAYGQSVEKDKNWLRITGRLDYRGKRASDGSSYYRAFIQELRVDGIESEVHLVASCLRKIPAESMSRLERIDTLHSSIERRLAMVSSTASQEELEGHNAALSLLRRAASLSQ